jgi:hypothetical protein
LFWSDDELEPDEQRDTLDENGQEDVEDNDSIDLEDDDAVDEEVLASMMTGGRFTREQVLEVRDLAKSLMNSLRQRAKAWKRPLDSLMRISNLVIATKERRTGGNVWNAYQSAFPEDPEKTTRMYCFFHSFHA